MAINLGWFEILLLLSLLAWIIPGPKDDTDKSYFKRSGMHLYTDYGTGLQYLSAPGFSKTLIPRLDENGRHVSIKERR